MLLFCTLLAFKILILPWFSCLSNFDTEEKKKPLSVTQKNYKKYIYNMLPSEMLKEGENYFYCSTETNILDVSMDVVKGQKRDPGKGNLWFPEPLWQFQRGNKTFIYQFTSSCGKSYWDSNSSTTHKLFEILFTLFLYQGGRKTVHLLINLLINFNQMGLHFFKAR